MFDDPSGVEFDTDGGRLENTLIALCAAYVSVVGFVLINPLGLAITRATEALF